MLALLLMSVLAGADDITRAEPADPIEPYRAAREAFIKEFRVNGTRNQASLAAGLSGLQSLANGTDREVRARAFLEIGNIQRLSNEFADAGSTYTQAAIVASGLGRSDLAFEAWVAVARSHILGTHDYGAAETAIEHAMDAAGSNLSSKQRRDVAEYVAELQEQRGETEGALVGAQNAVRFAQAPDDRFYPELLVGSALQNLQKVAITVR
jgi:hypothetical protein